jgi:hypothetical protein
MKHAIIFAHANREGFNAAGEGGERQVLDRA